MPLLRFDPPIKPGFPLRPRRQARTDIDPFGGGTVKSRGAWNRTLRRFDLVWNAADQALIDDVIGVWDRVGGRAEAFEWELADPSLYHPRPPFAPELGSVAGGALPLRTIRWAYAWGNANGETQIGPELAGTFSASTLATVTVPPFPTDATFAAIYALTGPGTLLRQALTITGSGGTFTEPVGGIAAGAAPSTVNAMSAVVRVAFADDVIEPEEMASGIWRVEVTLEERTIAGL